MLDEELELVLDDHDLPNEGGTKGTEQGVGLLCDVVFQVRWQSVEAWCVDVTLRNAQLNDCLLANILAARMADSRILDEFFILCLKV